MNDRGLWAVGLHHNMSLKAQQVNTNGSRPILPALNGDNVCQATAQQGGCSSMLSGLLLRPGISATFSSKLRAAHQEIISTLRPLCQRLYVPLALKGVVVAQPHLTLHTLAPPR